jgi:carbonic anhydrase/acetyltransferase-like protein (isoleucine patch superfamily)
MSAGKSALFQAGNATVVGDVSIGDDVGIWFGAVIRADKDTITINDGSNIQDNAVIHTTTGYPVEIGSYVSVGHGAILHGCIIGDRVLVGMGAIIMNGVTIGQGSIIGAGAVVTENTGIPPGSVVIGVPGRVVGVVGEDQSEQIYNNALSYINLARSYRN